MVLWEIIFLVVILKIPVAYVGGVVWWAIKAEPEVSQDDGASGGGWKHGRRRPPSGGRSERLAARGTSRPGSRAVRRQTRAGRSG
jgi:hypothetical protein